MTEKETKEENQASFRVIEIFSSVNGEGARSGQLALFIRMQGCNLNCAYCDTAWANAEDADSRFLSAEEIFAAVRASGIRNVTLTGGEPLLQENMADLLLVLTEDPWLRVEIETNGSLALAPLLAKLKEKLCEAERSGAEEQTFDGRRILSDSRPDSASYSARRKRISFNMDYKLPGSGMERKMCPDNFAVLEPWDTVKFVVADRMDLARARELIAAHSLTGKCRVFLSPVFDAIDPQEIVAYMKESHMNDVTLQLQLHKVIWNPETRGV